MKTVYLDCHATTPCDPRVLESMLPYFTQWFGNPSSTTHALGREADAAVAEARKSVAALIGSQPAEVLFTSGATESNNLAILGLARTSGQIRRRIVTSAVEHKSVLGPAAHLRGQGFDVIVLPAESDGTVALDAAEEAINEATLFASVQVANNEVGTIQPIERIAAICHARGVPLHCDAAQAVGKIPIDVRSLGIDLMSISAHKLYGPKGVGALYIRGGASAFKIEPLWFGGGQERELRPGTLNVPAIVGFGTACQICQDALVDEMGRIGALRDRLERTLVGKIRGLRRNGALHRRLPGNSNLTFPAIDAEALIANMPTVAVSTGSACTSGAPDPSHVLLAMGLSREEAGSTVRIGLGRFTTEFDIDHVCCMIDEAYQRILSIAAIV